MGSNFNGRVGFFFTTITLQDKNFPISSIKGNIEVEVGLSKDRCSNLNIRLMLALTDLLRVSDLGLALTVFTPK